MIKNRKSYALGLLVVCAALLGGCASSSIVPGKSLANDITDVRIVALEPTELHSLVGTTVAVPIPIPGVGVALVPPSARLKSVPSDVNESWSPTVVIAEELKRQLVAANKRAEIVEGIKKLPDTNNAISLWLKDSFKSTRDWYNSTDPMPEFIETPKSNPKQYVFVVGMFNHEVVNTRFVLQVVIKIIDPATGNVIGRTRVWRRDEAAKSEELFANKGELYRKTFKAKTVEIIEEALDYLALVPDPLQRY